MKKILDAEAALHAHQHLIAECAEMKASLLALGLEGQDPAPQIHAIRKHGKSLRGGCVLLGLEQAASREIQAIGKALSAARDATSRRNTWQKIQQADENSEHTSAIAALLERDIQLANTTQPQALIDWCCQRIDSATAIIQALPEEKLETLANKGLSTLQKAVRKNCSALSHKKSGEFHECRKAIKAYLGAVKFLPEAHITPPDDWFELAEVLGDENDHTTLAKWLNANGFNAQLAPPIWKKLLKTQRKTQKRAIQTIQKAAKQKPNRAPENPPEASE